MVYTIKISLLEFGKTELSPKMKDFLAYHMSEDDCKEICREYLENESEDRIKKENPNCLYDQAYTVICCLINKREGCNWFDIEKVLSTVNMEIVKKFTQKFKEAWVQGQLNKPLL